jgi:hypothetical protein
MGTSLAGWPPHVHAPRPEVEGVALHPQSVWDVALNTSKGVALEVFWNPQDPLGIGRDRKTSSAMSANT